MRFQTIVYPDTYYMLTITYFAHFVNIYSNIFKKGIDKGEMLRYTILAIC